MAKDLNNCMFIGRIGKDIDMKYTASGQAIANFSIACSDDYKGKDGQKVEQTNWVNIVAFGKLAEIIGQYCGKGSRIFVSGKQVTRKWEDGSGNTRYSTEINASDMQILDAKGVQSSNGQANSGKSQGHPAQQEPEIDYNDDIPF